MHMLQEKKASVTIQNKSFDTIMTVALTKCCGSRLLTNFSMLQWNKASVTLDIE